MPQVETKIERKPKDRWLAVGLAVLLIVVIIGVVLALKFWPKSTPKVTTTAALDNADDQRFSGDTDGAIKTLNAQLAATKNDSDRLNIYLALGGAYESKGNFTKALDYYQKAGAITPGYGTNESIARAAEKAGKKDLAISYYQKNKALIVAGQAPHHEDDLPDVEQKLKDLGASQ